MLREKQRGGGEGSVLMLGCSGCSCGVVEGERVRAGRTGGRSAETSAPWPPSRNLRAFSRFFSRFYGVVRAQWV